MKLPPSHAISDAVGAIEELARNIRRAAIHAEFDKTAKITDTRALAFIDLQKKLGDALSAFRAEIDGAKQ